MADPEGERGVVITVELTDGMTLARVSGDIDMANVGAIEDEISRNVTSEMPGFVLDLTDVTYLDSAGIRLMYQLDERATARQQALVVVIPKGAPISRSLEAAGAIGSFRIVASLAEAIDILKP